MSYIKVAHKKILKYLDENDRFPKDWNAFINKQRINHNLIIKSSKNNCYCTHCKHSFISTKKINQKTKCPNCHNKYLIKRSNLKYYEFKDYISLVDIVNDTLVVRYFEIKSIIDSKHESNYSVVEFARYLLINNNYITFVNENLHKLFNNYYISHYNSCKSNKWRINYYLNLDSIVYWKNLKKLFKNTKYEYSNIWNIAKHCSYIDIIYLLYNENNIKKVEFLSKMKLYNLTFSINKFDNIGSFQKIFGISKDFYPFMKQHNITYLQLEILKLLKEKNFKKIKYLEKVLYSFSDYITDASILEDISQYISLNRFIKYSKMYHQSIDLYLYKDYLRLAKLFNLNLKDNKYAFPKNLKLEHDKLSNQYKINKDKFIQQAIIKRGKELSKNIYKDNNFIILPACTLNSIQNESIQQNNCVKTYAEDYALGNCDIYFMRNINAQNKSLVTVEVNNNIVVQSRLKNNQDIHKKHKKFLDKWQNTILQKVA